MTYRKNISVSEALVLCAKHGIKTRYQKGGHILVYLPDRPVAIKKGRNDRGVHNDIVRHLNKLESSCA